MLELIPTGLLANMPCGWQWSAWLLAVTAVLLAWEDPVSLTGRFGVVLVKLAEWLPGRKLAKTYQGFIKAIKLHSAALLGRLTDYLRDRMPDWVGPYWTQQGWVAFAADGSRVECPRTAANERELGCAGRKRTGPQLFLTTLYHMGTGLPWSFRIGPGTDSERNHLRQMLPLLPPNSLLVADAGFVGYDLLDSILAHGQHFLIRVGSNVRLLQGLGFADLHDDQTVCLWPDKHRKRGQPPLALRLICLNDGRTPIFLLTDIPAEQLSNHQAGELYRLRWGIEVFYRSFKCTLGHRKMRSGAPKQAYCELGWAVLGLWILSTMTVRQLIATDHDPLTLSVTLALNTIRLALRHGPGDHSLPRLRRLLAQALKDGYLRTAPKKARNWPHKKTEKPPGPPKIKRASRVEIQLARSLRQHRLVA
jgi:hypothetical protein